MLGAAQTPQGWFPRVSRSTARDERPFLAHCLPAPGGCWVPGCRQGSGSCHSPWKAGVPQPLQPAAFAGISASDGLRHRSGPRQIRGRWGGGRVKGGNFSGSSRHMAPAGLAGDRGWQKGPPVPFPAEPPRSPPAANGAGAGITLGPGMGLCQPCQPSVTQGDGSKRTHGQGQTSSLPHGCTSSSGSSFLCRAPLTSAASRGDVGWPRARKGNRRLPALLKRSPTTFLLCVAAGSLAFPGCQRSWRIKPRAPTAAAARPR